VLGRPPIADVKPNVTSEDGNDSPLLDLVWMEL